MVVPIFNFFRIFILFFIMSIKLIYPTIHVCVGHLHVFFGKMSNQFPFPFLNWIVYYFLNQLWFLYISDINPLSDICEISPLICWCAALGHLLYKKYANHVFPLLHKTSYSRRFLEAVFSFVHHERNPWNSILKVDIGFFSFYS